MGLFVFFKRRKISPDDQRIIDNLEQSFKQITKSPLSEPISAEKYSEIRQQERDWLEQRYDFSSVESVSAIPNRDDLPMPPGDSPTGDIYYYLRYKARLYEQAGNIELAIACMRKSIALMQSKYGNVYGREECYSFVRMLARNGYSEEAHTLKERFDSYYSCGLDQMRLQNFQAVCRQAAELGTDLLIMSVLGSVCPECARYQGRVYSLSGKSKKFPPLPHMIKETGAVHPGCHHQFFPYIHKATSTDMEYTLQVHPLKNPRYGRDIISFSNRPFVDDRTEECKVAAKAAREKRERAKLNKQRYEALMIEREEEKRKDYQDFEWLKTHFPGKCPSSPSGYRRMKTQNTKNYQTLKQLARQEGREI